ncbi:putative SUMO ligase SizA [Tuber brumale]|nr:putative SUMO ligase SizA [Tuber brumale]
MSSYHYPERSSLIRYVMSHLIVRQLQSVLKSEGLPTSGLKAPLQKRLTTHIEDLISKGDTSGLERVKNLIYRPESPAPSRNSTVNYNQTSGYASPAPPMAQTPPYSAPGYGSPNTALNRIHFKESPFYSVLAGLTPLETCPIMTANRHSVHVSVVLSAPQLQQISTDKSYRCMVYCAAVDGITAYTKDTDIAFPHQVELRVNDVQISGLNLRGLKNRPGSTRPADITDYLNRKPGHRNQVTLTYALTQKKFAFVVNYVKTDSVEELVEHLRTGASITKETVIADMVRKNEDSDLVATSSIMSLKCPLSTLRIDLPIRSTFCNHMQCFDATSFLQLQQQAPTWSCPTCNKSISWKALVVDRYFRDILNNTPKTVDSVTIDVDGAWSVAAESSGTPMPDTDSEDGNEGRDDIIEVSGSRLSKLRVEATPIAPSPVNTASREGSASVPRGSISAKRPVSQVIDLTLSDDEDTVRPTKRINSFLTPTSMSSDGRGGGSGSNSSNRNGNVFSPFESVVYNGNGHSPVGTPGPFLAGGYGR